MVLAFVFLSLFDTFLVLTGQFCNSQEGCRQLKFEPAHISQGKRLTTHVIRTEDVMDGDFCQALCYMEPNCVSYNLRVKASNDGKYKCELNNSTIEGKPDKLEANPDYVYRGTKDKCLNNLCERHSTCQTGFTKKGYHCLCSAGFTGPYCETDIDECAFDATCSPNANCENTFGSYICNCNPEYYGDGKNCEQAHSCKEIYDRNILIDNGAYSLKVGGQTIDVYCHMKATADENACGDGGWTLVMKTDGTKQTFLYDSSLWDNQMSHDVQAGKTGFDNEETKLPTYWNTPFSKICLAMKTAGANNINFIILNMKASSLYSLIADGRHRQTNLSHLAWRSLIGPGANLLNYCNKEGFNVRSIVNDRARARIGIISNDADNCDRCNSRIGFGTAGESNAYTCGFMLFTNGLAAMGYIFVN